MLQQLKLAIIRAISHAKYEIQYIRKHGKTLAKAGIIHTTETRYITERATGKRVPITIHRNKNTNVIK